MLILKPGIGICFSYLLRRDLLKHRAQTRPVRYTYIYYGGPMERLIALIEKGKPFFNAIARNKYLKAIRDGFISVMPIIIVSSVFLLVSAVPNVWGFYWPAEINDVLMKAYNYSMGIVGICAAATTAKHFCDAQNRDLPKNNQINFISVMIASLIGFLLLSSDAISFTDNGVSISGLANGYMDPRAC